MVCVDVAGSRTVGADNRMLVVYTGYTDVAKTTQHIYSLSQNRFLRQPPEREDHFAHRQLLWPDFLSQKSFDSSKTVNNTCVFAWCSCSAVK